MITGQVQSYLSLQFLDQQKKHTESMNNEK